MLLPGVITKLDADRAAVALALDQLDFHGLLCFSGLGRQSWPRAPLDLCSERQEDA
jgi:hypothetical protein